MRPTSEAGGAFADHAGFLRPCRDGGAVEKPARLRSPEPGCRSRTRPAARDHDDQEIEP